MSTFYDIDSTRVSHREYWWDTRSPLVLIGWFTKWFRIRIPGSTDDPNVDCTVPFIVPALPPEIAARFEPLTLELAALGFREPVYHQIHEPGSPTTVYWATFRHTGGQHLARIHHRVWQRASAVQRALFPMFITEFTDGGFLVSSSGKPDLDAPPTVRMNRMRKAPTDKLWAAHEQLAANSYDQSIARTLTREQAAASAERLHVVLRDFHLARGVFRERSATEHYRAQAFATRVAEARASGLEHAEELAELDRLQSTKPSWGNAAWILVISIIAFLAVGTGSADGSGGRDWKFSLWLVPILLFHEAGHWVAMKLCRYRNLRMFFIPFFGAAVTGQNWNVPGWKKAIVSLAGPVPGILLGVVLAGVSLATGTAWLNMAAFLLLFLNGFNLLPVLPLDGGHVLHATLFCRNRWLDLAFRVLAVGGLLLLSLTGSGKVMLYVGIAMALGLPTAFALGKVTDALRHAPLPPPLPEEDRIPTPTAQAIIASVKAALPKLANHHKQIAQFSLNVFETLNARPPGALATLGLLGVHGASILLVLVFGALLIVGRHGGLGDFARAAMRQPQHNYACGSARYWPATPRRTGATNNHLIATFARPTDAAKVFHGLTNRLPVSASATLFGVSLLLALPSSDDAARERWFNELQGPSTNLFVVLSNGWTGVSFMAIAPTEQAATNLVDEMNEYLQVASFGDLITPWSPLAANADYNRHRQARQNWGRIIRETAVDWQDPKLKAINNKFMVATRRGSTTEKERLAAERDDYMRKHAEQARARLKADSASGIDPALVELHARWAALSYTNRVERLALNEQIAALLGPVPRVAGQPDPTEAARGMSFGHVTRTGLLIELGWASFKDTAIGLPALAEWLCAKGCLDLRYDFGGPGLPYGDEEEDGE
jgi:Zn-dependent protease